MKSATKCGCPLCNPVLGFLPVPPPSAAALAQEASRRPSPTASRMERVTARLARLRARFGRNPQITAARAARRAR